MHTARRNANDLQRDAHCSRTVARCQVIGPDARTEYSIIAALHQLAAVNKKTGPRPWVLSRKKHRAGGILIEREV